MYLYLEEKIFSWAAVGIFGSLIFLGSVLPAEGVSVIKVDNADKILHFFSYAILSVLISGTLKKRFTIGATKILLFTLISAGVYGILIELVQKAIPYRSAEIYDVGCNFLGIAFGIIINKDMIW